MTDLQEAVVALERVLGKSGARAILQLGQRLAQEEPDEG
jgi:hypothetical protein